MMRRRDFLAAVGGFALPGGTLFYPEPSLPDASLDRFMTEREFTRIAPVLEGWRAGLLKNVGNSLGDGFLGTSWSEVESRQLRQGSIEVRGLRFFGDTAAEPFLKSVGASLAAFSAIVTLELHVTRVAILDGRVETRIRYEIVGSGTGFYREQRIGEWVLQWRDSKVVRWQSGEEIRARSFEPWYNDVAANAFAKNSSYIRQLLYGADDWRTVLDGASGIDIYGHNGVSVGDAYGAGHDDVYICQPAGLPNRLYRNRGDGTFEDVTEASGVGVLENSACALFADFGNNGRQDLLVVRGSGPLLFVNQGNGKFTPRMDAFRFATTPQGTFMGAAAADYNKDGWLDIYFCLYTFYRGTDQYKYPSPYFAAENGPPNFMMHNNGDGTFRDVTAACGMDRNNTRYSFCCAWGDANGDGWPDLYVVNDFGKKNLYLNHRDGTFHDAAPEAGAEDVGAGMSVCWLGKDIYVGNMWTSAGERLSQDADFQRAAPQEVRALYRKHAMGNSLLRNDGSGLFRDVTAETHTGIGRWAWSCDAWDFDHDGSQDLYVANGMVSEPIVDDLNSFFWREVVAQSPNSAKPAEAYEEGWKQINERIRSDRSWSGFERNVFFANHGDGVFSDVSAVVGLDFLEDGRAFAVADFDGDGRQEILLKNRNAPQIRLLKNNVRELPPSIAFRLRGTKSNRGAIGASLMVGRQTRHLQAGSGFLSQHSKEVFFGLGDSTGPIAATITWPSGLTQELRGLPHNSRIWVTEGSADVRIEPFKTPAVQAAVPPVEQPPQKLETWLLVPVPAPQKAQPGWLTFVSGKEEGADVYNLLFRSIFDRRRDMPLPVSFLLDERQRVVKVQQGRVGTEEIPHIPRTADERLQKALPFPGFSAGYAFERNYLSLGSVFFQRGHLGAAEVYFSHALNENAAGAEALYGLGSVLLKQNKTAEAREYFERVTRTPASYPETVPNAWNNLGLLAARQSESEQAIRYFLRALELNGDHFIALENLGNAYRQQKRWTEAKAALEHALALKPAEAEANYSLAMVFAQENDTAKAYQHLQTALRAKPEYPEALNNLGILYLRTRRRDEAVAKFEECIRVAPDFAQAYLNLARVYTIENNPAKARQVLDDLAARQASGRL